MGVERFIHLSAMNADPNYKPVYLKNAQFLKTKGLGEQAVRDEFPSATIIRPGIIYGDNDMFIYAYLNGQRTSPWDSLYVYKAGEQTYKMPIFQYDASLGIAKAIMDPTAAGKTYEFVGPHCYKLSELIDFMYAKARCVQMTHHKFKRIGWPDPWFILLSQLTKVYRTIFTSRSGYINHEWIEFVDGSNDILTGVPLIGDVGVKRLAEFENAGTYYARALAYDKEFLETEDVKYPDTPLPLRSPPLHKHKMEEREEEVQTQKKPFGLSLLQSRS